MLQETLAQLRNHGYNLKFRREATCLYCLELALWIFPENFSVDEYHHLAGHTNPDGERTVFAISTIDGLKGLLVDTCFVYEDNISLEMNHKLQWNYAPAETAQFTI